MQLKWENGGEAVYLLRSARHAGQLTARNIDVVNKALYPDRDERSVPMMAAHMLLLRSAVRDADEAITLARDVFGTELEIEVHFSQTAGVTATVSLPDREMLALENGSSAALALVAATVSLASQRRQKAQQVAA